MLEGVYCDCCIGKGKDLLQMSHNHRDSLKNIQVAVLNNGLGWLIWHLI
jgi:hypothetical protein